MNIKNRLERLERDQTDAMQAQPGFWNFEEVSFEDLKKLRNLIDYDPGKAEALKQRLVNEGLLNYEHHKST